MNLKTWLGMVPAAALVVPAVAHAARLDVSVTGAASKGGKVCVTAVGAYEPMAQFFSNKEFNVSETRLGGQIGAEFKAALGVELDVDLRKLTKPSVKVKDLEGKSATYQSPGQAEVCLDLAKAQFYSDSILTDAFYSSTHNTRPNYVSFFLSAGSGDSQASFYSGVIRSPQIAATAALITREQGRVSPPVWAFQVKDAKSGVPLQGYTVQVFLEANPGAKSLVLLGVSNEQGYALVQPHALVNVSEWLQVGGIDWKMHLGKVPAYFELIQDKAQFKLVPEDYRRMVYTVMCNGTEYAQGVKECAGSATGFMTFDRRLLLSLAGKTVAQPDGQAVFNEAVKTLEVHVTAQ